jgi:hypothetical protein
VPRTTATFVSPVISLGCRFPLWYFFGCGYDPAFSNFRAGTWAGAPREIFVRVTPPPPPPCIVFPIPLDHTVPLNLFVHVVCLLFQVVSNFALLACVDKTGTLGAITAAGWSAVLLTSRAPIGVSAASIGILAAVAWLSPLVPAFWYYFALVNCIFEALALQVFLFKTEPGGIGFIGLAISRAALLLALERSGLRGAIAPGSAFFVCLVVLTGGMALLSARDDVMGRVAAAAGRKRLTPFYFGLIGWLVALLLDSPGVFFWANAFLASAVQGVAHRAAGEEGTLVNLQASAEQTTAHELSHTVYFPNLLLHTIYEKMLGNGPKRAEGKQKQGH